MNSHRAAPDPRMPGRGAPEPEVRPRRARRGLKYLVLGALAGLVVSITPFELAILLIPGLLILWVVAVARRPAGTRLTGCITAGLPALVVVVLAALLPMKQLDRNIGPIRYGRMSLDGLCEALSQDHRVLVRAPHPQGTNVFLEFHTDRVMTRRQILQKLAKDTDCELHIGYCGSGATVVFGAQPCFTSLDLRVLPGSSGSIFLGEMEFSVPGERRPSGPEAFRSPWARLFARAGRVRYAWRPAATRAGGSKPVAAARPPARMDGARSPFPSGNGGVQGHGT